MNLKSLILAAIGLLFLQVSYGQKVALALHENQFHVVQHATERGVIIFLNGEEKELPFSNLKMVLSDVAEYLPGYIQTQNNSATTSDFDEENRGIADSHVFLHEVDLTPNRGLKGAFITYQWIRPDNTNYMISVPLADMKAGESHHLRNRFYVPNRFKLVDPGIHYMTMGHEVATSENLDAAPKTPYEQVCEQLGVSALPDGNLKPFRMVPNPPINDAEGNARTGFVHLQMRIDENGFVTLIKPVKYSEWVFAKTVQMTAPFFEFQPKIKDGKPVATGVTVPFKF